MKSGAVTSHPTFSSDTVRVSSTGIDRWALARIRDNVAAAPIRFLLWDGFALEPDGAPIGSITFKNRRALFSWVRNPDLNFGEAYMFGAVEIQGSLFALLEAIYRALPQRGDRWRRLWQRANNLRASRENVHRHYDLGNDFYRLWLDRALVYTCAYFPAKGVSLEDAQVAKMDLVCRKLNLQPGDRVVETGCGWGALALHMATRYGARVRAFNISSEQIAYARARAKHAGIGDQVEFIEEDYRNLHGTCDVFVSVGMLEHVGLAEYASLGEVIDRSLAPHGRGLLHFIGRDRPGLLNPWIRKRIFPGAYPPTLSEVSLRILEPHGLSVLDVENLRLHYAKTLEHWSTRFERHADRIAAMFDDTFVRAWRLYLAGSQAAFSTGSMQLFQVLFARGGSNQIAWTRADR
jgi:cyclopropane-fatty-acyl-phospholipid synthase